MDLDIGVVIAHVRYILYKIVLIIHHWFLSHFQNYIIVKQRIRWLHGLVEERFKDQLSQLGIWRFRLIFQVLYLFYKVGKEVCRWVLFLCTAQNSGSRINFKAFNDFKLAIFGDVLYIIDKSKTREVQKKYKYVY